MWGSGGVSGARTLSAGGHSGYAASTGRTRGVHTAHVVIDGVIDSPNTHQWGAGGMQLMDPSEIAEAYLSLHAQPPTCWSFEIQLSSPKTQLGQRL